MDKNLMMTICLCLGLVALGGALIYAMCHRKNTKSVIRAIGIGVFSSMFFLVYPYATVQSGIFALPFALFQVMASAVIASDPLAIFETLQETYNVPYLELYQALLIILHVIAPLFTIGITLSFFESRFAPLLYRIKASGRESHIFSDVNERTLSLAESIYASNKHSVLVFIGDMEQLEQQRDHADRVRKVGGYVMDIPPSEVRHSLRHVRTYYLLSPEGGRNLKDALHLLEKYDKTGGDRIKIWLYSKEEISSVIFDNIDERIDIRLVNEEKLISMELMRKYPLYQAIDQGKLEIMILGAGNIGMEILKTALWCSRLGDAIKVNFRVLDLYASKAQSKLEKQCPGLAEHCRVTFHTLDIEGSEFYRELGASNPDYIVISLGEEQRNIRIGAQIRRFYGLHPRIHVLTDHADTETMVLDMLKLSDWRFDREKGEFVKTPIGAFDLLPFGSYDETYSTVRFSKGYHDLLAMAINAHRFGITKIDEMRSEAYFRQLLNKVEFYKDQSYSYATAIPYKLRLMGLDMVCDGKGDLSLLDAALPKYERLLLEQEGERWRCYMRTQGWAAMSLDEVDGKRYQDKLRKRHARLDRANTQRLSELVGRDFAAEDRASLYRLPSILALANALTDKPYSIISLQTEVTQDGKCD